MISKGDASRDVQEGEDKPSSAGLINDVEISALAEELASIALSAKNDDDANSNPNSDAASYYPERMKPHPPSEDCALCFVPLPVKKSRRFL